MTWDNPKIRIKQPGLQQHDDSTTGARIVRVRNILGNSFMTKTSSVTSDDKFCSMTTFSIQWHASSMKTCTIIQKYNGKDVKFSWFCSRKCSESNHEQSCHFLGGSRVGITGIILCVRPANERRRYIVTSSLIGWVHTQNNPWIILGRLTLNHSRSKIVLACNFSSWIAAWSTMLPHHDMWDLIVQVWVLNWI